MVAVNDKSILDNVKELVGVMPSETGFDEEIISHINTVFGTLQQLGVGPVDGFEIEDQEPKWSAYLGDTKILSMVKSYMKLRVRLLFDPPPTSFGITSFEEQVKQFEWRLNVAVETPPREESETLI